MVALPLLIAFIMKGTVSQFSIFIYILSLIGLYEFYQMALPDRKLEGLLATCSGVFLCYAVQSNDYSCLLSVLTLLVLFFGLVFLLRLKDIRQAAGEVALTFLGFLYVPLLLGHLYLLRTDVHGIEWIFLLLVIVMMGDTAAFYVGSALGKRKLYPAVSPKKSIEGSLGGLGGSMAGAFAAKLFFFPELAYMDCVLTALLLGVMGQLGDLFESLLKRSFGVKDSGKIIPGHGGILDRLDSILFAAPAAFFYVRYFF